MIKIIKSTAIAMIMFGGLQLICEPFTTQLLIGFDQKEKQPAHISITLDTADTGAQAKEKIHKQTKVPIENMYIYYVGDIGDPGNCHVVNIWKDNKTFNEIKQATEDQGGGVFELSYLIYLTEKLISDDDEPPKAAEGAVKKDGE